MSTRTEWDSMGALQVPAEHLWGAQTQRSLTHFSISNERMPLPLLRALATIKKAAALVNAELGELDGPIARAIASAADEVILGQHDEEFPLRVWQTGSGTQTHMNMNEVLANRASEMLGGGRGTERKVHPNDHVNRGQSSNDVFSAALNVACTKTLSFGVLPSLEALATALQEKVGEFADLVKTGRTHLQDATPLTLGQEISGWVAQLEHAHKHLESTLPHLSELALGGTAVGTGLNAHPEYATRVAHQISLFEGLAFASAPNKFEALAAHDAVVFAHGALKTLAVALIKIANDVRWLASGPRCGIGELLIPENEPGSSIMPGKVNPTQCEALIMCCMQVIGNDVTINLAGSSGNFELNVCKPVMAYNFLQSAALLTDAMIGFRVHLVNGMAANRQRIAELLNRSLMLVTALSPYLGYEKAAEIAHQAHSTGKTLREVAVEGGWTSEAEFDRLVKPERMIGERPKP